MFCQGTNLSNQYLYMTRVFTERLLVYFEDFLMTLNEIRRFSCLQIERKPVCKNNCRSILIIIVFVGRVKIHFVC